MIRKKYKNTIDENNALLGPKLNFAAAEAYKLLRTNLNFTIPDQKGGKIIGITSAIRGEGKSTTSINLAYTLAEDNKNVALLEFDMRLPNIARRLGIPEKPGLSNFLAGINTSLSDVLVPSGLHPRLYVLPAGDIPPNPSELLGSKELVLTVEYLVKNFDYIIFDLPPVNAVSDALLVSKLTHGMIMVVRKNYNNQWELSEAMRQLKIVDAKILGFVVSEPDSKDGKHKYYKKYGYGYGYGEEQRPGRKDD